jgi:4'-phosphopantetheinyl transferase
MFAALRQYFTLTPLRPQDRWAIVAAFVSIPLTLWPTWSGSFGLLSAATGVPAEEIAFAEGRYGKPCLVGTNGPHFNVSHSGCWALIGFSDSRDIGVDIEFMRAAGCELDLARSFFSAAEYRSLEGLANGMLLSSFYKIWTCKEAVLKAHGAEFPSI